jgi:hypothetical protein
MHLLSFLCGPPCPQASAAQRVVKTICENLVNLWLKKDENQTSMDFKQVDQLASQEPPLPYLVIGGYAVVAHGYSRMTIDIDLLVRRTDKLTWHDRCLKMGLRCIGQSNAFAQYDGDDNRLDLMFVDMEAFDKMNDKSIPQDFGQVDAMIVGLDHLIALKLHASKDFNDIEMLARHHALPITSDHYKELFLKYGTQQIYETLQRCLKYG